MADAVVKGEMRMDNQQFLAAAKQSTAELRRVKTESRELAKEISGVNSVANGLASIMSGNVSAGLASVTNGMKDLSPKMVMAAGKIGLVVAAFGAAYTAGKKLDSMFQISDWLVNRFGTSTAETDELAKQTEIIRAHNRARWETTRIEEENILLAERRLKGVARLEADFARERIDMEKQIAEATHDNVRTALQNRLQMMENFHAQDVAAIKDAEAEKTKAMQEAEETRTKALENATAARTRAIQDANDRMVIAMLEGAERVRAEFAKDIQAIEMKIEAPDTTEAQRVLLEQQKEILEMRRDTRIAQMDEADAPQSRSLTLGPADAMARTGGFLGGERMNLSIESKAERIQADNNRYLQINNRAMSDLTQQVRSLSEAITGGVI